MRINKHDTNGTKPLLGKGELGYDDYPTGGDAGRVYVGTGATNISLAKKSEVTVVDSKADTHIARVDNPHSVTKTQVGLANVDNTADVVKNVLSATKWTTPRNIALTGDVTGNINIDGSANVSIATTISANSVALGTNTTGNYVAGNTAGTGITVTGTAGEGWSPTISIDSTVATLTGAQTLTNKTLQDSTTFIVDNTDATKKVQFDVAGVTTATTRTMTVPNVNGTLVTTGDTGSVTSTMILDGTIVNADINASAGIVDTKLATISTAGKVSNSATTATNLNTASAIVARDASGNFTAGNITADLTGNSSTATALQTARTLTIGSTGKTFDGTANVSWSVAEIGAQPVDADLTAISALAGTSGLLKKTAADTWTLDTTAYTTNTGTVTGVIGTAPVVSSGGTTPAISMAAATASVDGYMTSTYASKLNGIATGANNYVHPTTDGLLHVPATSTTNNGKVLTAGATAGSLSWTTPSTADATKLPLAGGTMTGAITAIRETKVAMAANNIDLATGNLFTKTISGATTLTISNALAAGNVNSFVLELTNGGSAVITWFSGVKWAGGIAPTLTTSGKDILGFYSHDGGATWNILGVNKDVK